MAAPRRTDLAQFREHRCSRPLPRRESCCRRVPWRGQPEQLAVVVESIAPRRAAARLGSNIRGRFHCSFRPQGSRTPPVRLKGLQERRRRGCGRRASSSCLASPRPPGRAPPTGHSQGPQLRQRKTPEGLAPSCERRGCRAWQRSPFIAKRDCVFSAGQISALAHSHSSPGRAHAQPSPCCQERSSLVSRGSSRLALPSQLPRHA